MSWKMKGKFEIELVEEEEQKPPPPLPPVPVPEPDPEPPEPPVPEPPEPPSVERAIGANANPFLWNYPADLKPLLPPICGAFMRWNGTTAGHGFDGTTQISSWDDRITPDDTPGIKRITKPIISAVWTPGGSPFFWKSSLMLTSNADLAGLVQGNRCTLTGSGSLKVRYNDDEGRRRTKTFHPHGPNTLIEPLDGQTIAYNVRPFLAGDNPGDVEVVLEGDVSILVQIKPLIPMETKIDLCNDLSEPLRRARQHRAQPLHRSDIFAGQFQ